MSLYSDLRGALRTRLLTVSGIPDAPQRAWEGRDFTPTAGTAWLRDTVLPAGADRVSVGPYARVRHLALYQVDLFVPALRGTEGDGPADAIIAAFWPGLVLSYNGQTVLVRSATRGPAITTDAAWRQLPMSIAVEMDTTNPA